MGQLFTNNATAILQGNISAVDTQLTVTAALADLFKVATTSNWGSPLDWYKVTLEDNLGNTEIVKVGIRTLGSGILSNLLRGQDGTAARNWNAGANVSARFTAQDLTAAVGGVEALEAKYAGTGAGDGDDAIGSVAAFSAAAPRTVRHKNRERVSFTDAYANGVSGDRVTGNWNGTDSIAGVGIDNTLGLQAAINYCVSTGAELFGPPGRYRTTAPLVIDRSMNVQDPINGGMFGMTMIGGGPASCQIVSDHSGPCVDFRGGDGAGWHTYFNLDGVGLLKSNYNRSLGSVGLKITEAAYVKVSRFDMYGFEYGIDGYDVLSSELDSGTIRGNAHGWRLQKGSRSHPNNIQFRGVKTINNIVTGGSLIKPGLFSYYGGSIESNGYTGILEDPASWGLYVESGGTEAAVGINMQGVYFENNNGKADVWILQTANNVIHNFNGCSFLRFQNTRYVTHDILFNSTNKSRVTLSGCGFRDQSTYVSDPSRPFVAGQDFAFLDGGGNIFLDNLGGNTGIIRTCFSPVGVNHSTSWASLPNALENRNGIQYVVDAGGGATRPGLGVSDGTKWNPIVFGKFAGAVSSAGVAQALPRGWTCSKNSAGVYTITHNLGISGANQYAVSATPTGASGLGHCSGYAPSGNSFEIYFSNLAGALTDMPFAFNFEII